MNKKTVRDIDLKGKRVLMRVDFNVPMADGVVTDDKRIRAALPTIQYVLDQGASLILMSHLGRPKGGPRSRVQPEGRGRGAGQAARPAGADGARLRRPRGRGAGEGAEARRRADARKHPLPQRERRRTILAFAKQLAALGDVYVNDAFGSAHRAHASTEGVARYLPAVSGFLMEQELEYLGRATDNPERPYVAILGGAKISDKIVVIENLLAKCDTLLIGGGMANTFLAAKGYDMADSLVEADAVATAKAILAKAGEQAACCRSTRSSPTSSTPRRRARWSMSTRSRRAGASWTSARRRIAAFGEVLKGAKLVVWNGPMGVFEIPKFAEGTFAIARLLAEARRDHRDRRRRQRERGEEGRRRQEDDARLHRRRRFARVPGRQGAARRRGARRPLTTPDPGRAQRPVLLRRSSISRATKRASRIAGKSWPISPSSMASERAPAATGVMSP